MTPPPKHLVALKLLETSGIFVSLDPRHRDVVVPAQFKTQQELVLQFGLNMRIPIKDLEVEEDGISGTLSFSRRPFWCKIPWFAVHSIVSDVDRRGFSWGPSPGAVGSSAPPPKRSHLRAVGPNDPPPPEADIEGTCKHCAIKWPEDASSCPLCGSSREEAFASASAPAPSAASEASTAPASAPDAAEETKSEGVKDGDAKADPPEPPDEPPPTGPKPGRPFLRLVK